MAVNKKNRLNIKTISFAVLLILTMSASIVVAISNSTVIISSSGTIDSTSISPLHIDGRYVKDSSNQIVQLKGVDFTRFIDTPYGDWIQPNGQIVWANWNPSNAASNLDAMSSWGVKSVRTLSTAEWWKNNVGNHRQIIKDWIQLAASRGIYVTYCFWRSTGSSQQNPLPYPPYNNGDDNTIISSTNDFVNLWISVASELKDYPNVIFELWNEPNGNADAQASWFNVTQQCITAIRGTGATNLIVVQWGYCAGVDMAGFSSYNSGNRVGSLYHVDWINQFPLNDPSGNILYSTHLYRNSFYDSSQGYKQMGSQGWVNYTSNDLEWALNITGVSSNSKALWIGEIGPNQWNTEDIVNEYGWYDGCLAILNQNGIGYAAWEWWPAGAWTHLTSDANYTPNQAGTILYNRLMNSML